MKIVHLIPYFPPLGGEKYVVNLSVGILRLNSSLDVKIIAYKLKSPIVNNDYLIDNLHNAGIDVKYIEGRGPSLAFFNFSEIIKTIIEEKPDILHVHTVAYPYPLLAYILRKIKYCKETLRRPTIITTFHGVYDFVAFPFRDLSLLLKSVGNVATIKKMFSSINMFINSTAAVLSSDFIISVAYSDLPFINKIMNITGARRPIRVIHGGVDIIFFSTKWPAKDKIDGNPAILYIGRLNVEKGIDILFKVLKILINRLPDIKLYIVSRDRKNYRIIQKMAKAYGLDNRVILLGEVREKDLPVLLAKVDMLVQPSRAEGASLVIMEAMSVGTPIVASSAGDNRIFLSSKRGILADYKNPSDFAYKIEKLYKNKDLMFEISQNARKFAKRVFNWKVLATRHLNLYVEVLSDRRS